MGSTDCCDDDLATPEQVEALVVVQTDSFSFQADEPVQGVVLRVRRHSRYARH
jgi:hypothetical protein